MESPDPSLVTDGPSPERKAGRRKINIEFIEDKSRRHITFSKRKAGIMKKAYELSTLTGTQVLLLVASETGHVYTFATPKLQPLITKPEGKNLIQACLNAADVTQPPQPTPHQQTQRIATPAYPDTTPLLYPPPVVADPIETEQTYENDDKKENKLLSNLDFGGAYPAGIQAVRMYPMPVVASRYLPSANTQYPPYQPNNAAGISVPPPTFSQHSSPALNSASPFAWGNKNLGVSGAVGAFPQHLMTSVLSAGGISSPQVQQSLSQQGLTTSSVVNPVSANEKKHDD